MNISTKALVLGFALALAGAAAQATTTDQKNGDMNADAPAMHKHDDKNMPADHCKKCDDQKDAANCKCDHKTHSHQAQKSEHKHDND